MKWVRHRLEALRAWYEKWLIVIQAMTAAGLIVTAIFVSFVAWSLYSYRSYGDQLVQRQCHRSREFGPPVAEFYARERVLTGRELDRYKATIPAHC